ncbi:MAG: NPCBM/NEW2 domain-containing protein [Phycisphaeraceae bacterium]
MVALHARADVVDSVEEGVIGGTVTLERGDDALTVTDREGNARSVRLIDLDRVIFGEKLLTGIGQPKLVVNNDNGVRSQFANGTIKLRAGLHRITLPYWQTGNSYALKLTVIGPDADRPTEVDQDFLRCYRNSNTETPQAPGIDANGFRLPELTLEQANDRRLMLARARYRLYVGKPEQPVNSVAVLNELAIKRSGSTSAIAPNLVGTSEAYAGIVFDAFFIADRDGEYEFKLDSDDGSQLYFGEVSDFRPGNLGNTPINKPWRIQLRHDGLALGELKTITDQTLLFHIPLVSDAPLSLSQVLSAWDTSVPKDAIDRANEASNEDTVYLRDKNDPAAIRSVSGKIVRLDEASLVFLFRGKERTIGRDRVVGMVFRHADRSKPTNPGLHQLVYLDGGQVLPCRVKAIGDYATIELLAGATLTPPRKTMLTMRSVNGRRVDLTAVEPSATESVPYFGLALPHRVNRAFNGEPIALFDDKTYGRGLAVHSKSRLHYKLDRPCERFEATFGLLKPNGRLGDVTARIIGDGSVLWEQTEITADTEPIAIDVPLVGIQRLILEVDFGGGQDVGDRAAWCDPRLILSDRSVEDAEGDAP